MSKCKVLQIVPALNDGGAETLAVNYVSLMDKQEFEPVLVSLHVRTNTVNYQRVQGKARMLTVYKTNSFVKKVMFRLFGDRYIPAMLKKLIEQEKPQAIHIHLQILKYFVPISSCLKGIRLYYTCHSEPWRMFKGKEEQAARYLIKHNNLCMVALHEDMRLELNEKFGANNTVIIKNGVDFNKFRNVTTTKEQIRIELGIPTNAFVLGHIGRFVSVKNHAFLVDVFREAWKREPSAYLLLVGSGELYEQIESQIKEYGLFDRVKMFKSRADIPEILKAMDVMVFPSFLEGLPVTLVEAQAAGLRCVVSDRVNIASFMSRTTVALSLDDSYETWADAVLDTELVTDKEYADIEEYDLNREIKKLERLYEGA